MVLVCSEVPADPAYLLSSATLESVAEASEFAGLSKAVVAAELAVVESSLVC